VHDDVTPMGTQNLVHPYSLSKVVPKSEGVESDRKHNSCLGSKSMTTLEERIETWIYAECNEPKPQTRQRFRELNLIFRNIYTDPRFWQYQNYVNRNYYEEALSRMWRYLRLNLCEATTARKSGSFLKTRTYAIGRLLTNLKGHLKNIQIEIGAGPEIPINPIISDDGTVLDPFEILPNSKPDIAARQFDALLHLLEADSTGELNDPVNALRGTTKTTQQPYVLTAQTYLLMRYRDDMTIQQIADTLDIRHGSVQGGAKPTKWKELARKFARTAIDSVSA
jgi:hypothetical protein